MFKPTYGPYYDFYPTGQLREEGFMIDGLLDYSKTYDKNGTLRSNKQYIDNNIYKHIYYQPNGHLEEELFYKNKLKHGQSRRYHYNGTIRTDMFYYEDSPIGQWIYYNNDGTVIMKDTFKGNMKYKLMKLFTLGRYPKISAQLLL